jgi:hypothetical protein
MSTLCERSINPCRRSTRPRQLGRAATDFAILEPVPRLVKRNGGGIDAGHEHRSGRF